MDNRQNRQFGRDGAAASKSLMYSSQVSGPAHSWLHRTHRTLSQPASALTRTEGFRPGRHPCETLRARLEGLPKAVRDIAWKAQVRLCARYRRLSATGKKLPVVVAAIAREMAAFLWAIGGEDCPDKTGQSSPPAAQCRGWSHGGGTPVVSYVAGLLPDARPLDRGKSRDEDTEGGTPIRG